MNSISVKQSSLVAALAVIITITAFNGCANQRSDSANALHENARANHDALIDSQTASRQATAAQPLSGDALLRTLSGNSHVSEFRKAADAKPYLTSYHYFRPDGVRDTYARRTSDFEAVGSWQVKQNLLCVSETTATNDSNCFTLKVTVSGVIQYWMHKPGDPFHGLLSANVEIVRPGLQTPEYVTTQAMYAR
jgi:hypothetical protein